MHNKHYDDYLDKVVCGDLDYITEAELGYYNSMEYDADYDVFDDDDNYKIDDDFDFDFDNDIYDDDIIFY